MRQGIGKESYERMFLILSVYPFQCLVVDDAGRILFALEIILAEHRMLDVLFHHLSYHRCISHCTTVAVQKVRIIEMSLKLADIAIEFVHATLVGSRNRTLISASPFPEYTGSVSFVLHDFGQNLMLRVVRFLSYDRILLVVAIFYHWHTSPVFLVSTHMCMSRMLTRHDGSSRRSRDGRTGISLGESHSLLCHPVYIRRVDIRLTVASQIAISHVVTQYEENVGRGVLFCTEQGRKTRQTYPCKPYCLVHINIILFGFFTHLPSDFCDR